MSLDIIQRAFLELLRGGLWEQNVDLREYRLTDFAEILRLATEQSVIGLVAAGLEHIKDVKVPKEWALQFIGATLQIELRNKEMNEFVARLIELLRENDIYAILVKGQGIAQCYEKPLWRACGDVDLFLSEDNYKKAKEILVPLATSIESENEYTKHLGMVIDGWEVELHGNIRSGLSKKIDKGLDKIAKDVFYGGNVRSTQFQGSSSSNVQVFLMAADVDVVYIFTHILQHFFKGGIGLRQVCDWCRLMYAYCDKLDLRALEARIKRMGLMSEWRVFATLAVQYLGAPAEAMPLFGSSTQEIQKFNGKAGKVMRMILETGNFGHNRDESYRQKYNGFVKRAISVWRYTQEGLRHFMIFPKESVTVWFRQMKTGIRASCAKW